MENNITDLVLNTQGLRNKPILRTNIVISGAIGGKKNTFPKVI
jgi:hypothetical protein